VGWSEGEKRWCKRVNMVEELCIHVENRTMKPVEIVLRRKGEGVRENDGGGSLIKVHCSTYGNATMKPSVQLINANKDVF
jgi:hypothetical protein